MNPAFWDERFGAEEYAYGTAPNDFLRAQVGRIPSGPVLCLAEGEGRNAVFLAREGRSVTAVDFSREGLRKTEQLARSAGVSVRTVHADLAEYEPPAGVFSGVVAIFAHLPPAVRAVAFARAARALIPGGVFVLEAYTVEQVALGTGGPRDPSLCMSLDALEVELAPLTVVLGRHVRRDIHEGAFHDGPSATVQLVAARRSE